jgi:hypothetical protein
MEQTGEKNMKCLQDRKEKLPLKDSLVLKDPSGLSEPGESHVKEQTVKPVEVNFTPEPEYTVQTKNKDSSSPGSEAKVERTDLGGPEDESKKDIPTESAIIAKPRSIHGSRPSTPRSSQEDSGSDGIASIRKKQTARKSMAASNEKQLSMLKRSHTDDLSSDEDQASKRVRDCKVKLMDISHSPRYSDYVDVSKSRLPGDLASTSGVEQVGQSEDPLTCKDKDSSSFSDKVADESGVRGTCTGYSSAPELPRRTRGRPRKHPLPGGATPPRQHSPASASDKEMH